MSKFKYPSVWQSCRLGWAEMTNEDKWDACCSCRHFDECEFKDTYRIYSVVGIALILLSAVFISAVVAYLIGVL